MWAAGPVWIVTLVWWSATVLYIAAGLGTLGFRQYRRVSAELAFAALIPSSLLLGTFAGLFVLPGIALDMILLFALVQLNERTLLGTAKAGRHWGRTAGVLTTAFLVYTSAVILARPWAMQMGTSRSDRAAQLFGDSLNRGARYRVDNAIVINAPADSVWPWIAQIGRDRGGVVAIDSGRALVLDKWGAFIVRPIDDNTSQLYIRQRSRGAPSFGANLLAPVGLLVLEPAHFVRQRGMLHEVKRRAERSGA